MTTQTKAILFTMATGGFLTSGAGFLAGAAFYFAARNWYKVYKSR